MKQTLKRAGVAALGLGAGVGVLGWQLTDLELCGAAVGLGIAGGWRPWVAYRKWRDGP